MLTIGTLMRVILESCLLPQIENVTSHVIPFQVIEGIVAEGLLCVMKLCLRSSNKSLVCHPRFNTLAD
jgi:hypothetical protein